MSNPASLVTNSTTQPEQVTSQLEDGENCTPETLPADENLVEQQGSDHIMDDISSFLDKMHSKNLMLKKLAAVQQRRIDDLTRENQALKFENELKDIEVKEVKAQVAILRDELQNPSGKSAKSPQRRAACKAGDAPQSCSESDDTVSASPSSSNSAGKPVHLKTAVEKPTTADMKKAMIASHRAAIGRMMQIARKIHSVR